jgi:hypothetical protein
MKVATLVLALAAGATAFMPSPAKFARRQVRRSNPEFPNCVASLARALGNAQRFVEASTVRGGGDLSLPWRTH